MEYVLETRNLNKSYKDFKSLSNLSIHVPKNSIYGLIGKNGAGKTTLIRIITGLQNPTSGEYSIYGVKYPDSKITEIRKRMGAIVETPSIYNNMSAIDNLKEQYKIVGLPDYEGLTELLKFVGLEHTAKKKARNFSLGMKQRLGIAIALVGNPDFLILDEPINGLDPEGIIEIRELILKLNQEKQITILISSHYLDELSKIATHYGFMDAGSIIKEISREQLNQKLEKKIEITVNKASNFIPFLEKNKLSYTVVDEKHINLFGNINMQKLLLELAQENLSIKSIHEKEESLENYYMNLLGGDKND